MLEKILGKFEDKFSLFVDFIEGIDEEVLNECLNNASYVNTLKIMLSIQFWRNPQSSKLALKSANNLMGIFDSAHELNRQVLSMPRKEIKFIFKRRENAEMQKIIQFFLLPLLTFPLNGQLPKSFRINRRPSASIDKFITSDNPIYTQKYNEVTNCFEGEFAFPLTESLILTNLACSNEAEFNIIQTKLVDNAYRCGISSSKSTLDKLVDCI
ncbi:MAG: hypothetical protein ACJAYB_002414 [Psychromonas sp.]|jgi:hypothetical protein